MKRLKLALVAGFAMFSMFFGSGNLVFPITLGSQTLGNVFYAGIGLILTGIFVPFLGLISVMTYHGNRKEFFSKLGSWAPFFFTAVILSLIGPFGVVPRCVLVAFGGVQLIFPELQTWMFSGLFCVITAFLIYQKHSIVEIIAKWLTPFKLGSILLLVLAGILLGNKTLPVESGLSFIESFSLGAHMGYQTMDLLASFFFSVTIVRYLKRSYSEEEDSKDLLKTSLYASVVGGLLLIFVYGGFLILGAKYAPELQGLNPENYLVAIAGYVLGPIAKPLVAIILFFACLTTATILTSLFTDFLVQDLSRNKLPRELGIIITLLITFCVSLLGFSTIAVFLSKILTFFYPALIALAFGNLIDKLFKISTTVWLFWITFLSTIALYFGLN